MESFFELSRFKNATKRVVLMRRTGMAKRKISIIGSMMIVASDCVRWSLKYVANIFAFARPRMNSSEIHASWKSDFSVTFS